MSIRERIGVFFVTKDRIEDSPEKVMAVMGKCIVIDCKYNYARDLFEYTALSKEFDLIKPGQIEPEYSATVEEIDDQVKVSFKRISA